MKGATGATSSVLHGTVKGAGAAVGGVAGAGKAVTKGVTSGSVVLAGARGGWGVLEPDARRSRECEAHPKQ